MIVRVIATLPEVRDHIVALQQLYPDSVWVTRQHPLTSNPRLTCCFISVRPQPATVQPAPDRNDEGLPAARPEDPQRMEHNP